MHDNQKIRKTHGIGIFPISTFLISLAPHDALFIVGALDEALLLRGLRYHPVDLEMSVIRCHKGIGEW